VNKNHSNLEDELFEWVCHVQVISTPVGGPTFREKANGTVLKMGIKFQHSKGQTSLI